MTLRSLFRRLGSTVLMIGLLAPAMLRAETIIINRSNPVTQLSVAEVRNMFLGNTLEWEDDTKVQIADYPASFPLRVKFSEERLQFSPAKVYMQWIKVSLAGRGVPPKIFHTEEEVKRYVAANPGAIGYVSSPSGLPAEVKIVPTE